MKGPFWVTTLVTLGIAIARAAPGPCPAATLDQYLGPTINGNGGCIIGDLLFAQFKYTSNASGPAVKLDAANINVVPLQDSNGTGFVFTPRINWIASATGWSDGELQYVASSITGAKTTSALYTEVNGNVTSPAFAKVTELYCPGGTTLPPDQLCPLTNGVQVLWVTANGKADRTFLTTNSIAVYKDVELDARQGGSATVTSFKNQVSNGCTVTSATFTAITGGAAIDANPNAEGGQRIFAEKATATGAVLNQVSVAAKITTGEAGKRVYFKSFDVDDPSSDASPVDPNGKLGNDNRGAPKDGLLSASSAITDQNGTAAVTFATTQQPGDNFKVAASCNPVYLVRVNLNPRDGGIIQDASTNPLPTDRAKLTQMLTVWRKVHIEVDAMKASAGNFYKGKVTGIAAAGGGKLDIGTDRADMDPMRLENGRLVITDIGAFSISGNTASRIRTPDAVPAAAMGKDFTAYDDDDFNGNDGASKKGDTDEALVAPDQSLIQDSDDANKNVFAPGYVRPTYDVTNAKPNPDFLLNADATTVAGVRAAFEFDNRALNSDADFWTVYLLGGYQANTDRDHDPDTQNANFGVTDALRGTGSIIFLELVSPGEIAAVRSQLSPPVRAANAISNAIVTAHEMGHLFGGIDGEGGIMNQSGSRTQKTFSDRTLAAIRGTPHP